jgi:hypothetical protein
MEALSYCQSFVNVQHLVHYEVDFLTHTAELGYKESQAEKKSKKVIPIRFAL